MPRPVWDFIVERRDAIVYNTFQHASLVVQAVAVATVLAVLLAVLINRTPRVQGVANMLSAVGLTLPSFALVSILLTFFSFGPTPAFLAVAFYAVLPILRNAVVGLQGVDETLVESARGMGMSELTALWRVRLPLAWPVILAGVRVSMQMSMGVAAIAAYVGGPGLGGYIFKGLTQIGSANAINYAVVGTVGVVIVALLADVLLLALGRVTISKGIRV